MRIFEKIGFVFLGAIIAVVLFCLITAIGCSVNGVSFSQQIIRWLGEVVPVIENGSNITENIMPIV